jgi:hypothetical protein
MFGDRLTECKIEKYFVSRILALAQSLSRRIPRRIPPLPHCSTFFASPKDEQALIYDGCWGTGGHDMILARPLHMAMVCAAFLFVAAVVLGAI